MPRIEDRPQHKEFFEYMEREYKQVESKAAGDKKVEVIKASEHFTKDRDTNVAETVQLGSRDDGAVQCNRRETVTVKETNRQIGTVK